MAEGFDLGSIYSTLDLDMTGFMAGLDQGRSALADFIKNSAAQVLTLPPPALPDAALQAPDVGQGVSATPSQLAEAARAPLERLDALDMSVPPLQLADDLAPRTPPLTAPRLPPLAAQVTELPAKMSRAATSAA